MRATCKTHLNFLEYRKMYVIYCTKIRKLIKCNAWKESSPKIIFLVNQIYNQQTTHINDKNNPIYFGFRQYQLILHEDGYRQQTKS
jgi:hypothetical protein